MTKSLASAVAASMATWDDPVVDQKVFGTTDPHAIATLIDAWCTQHLGAAVAEARFYRASVGCVSGVELTDGRAVVVKAQHGGRPTAYLDAVHDARLHLVQAGFPCPEPLVRPTAMGPATATAEALSSDGTSADAHEPAVRQLIAASLAEVVDHLRGFADHPAFGRAWFGWIPREQIWPAPHSPFFDFEATRRGAEWIDAIAQRALDQRARAAGDRVVGHFDWRVEHLRFDGGRVVATYDWDSLHAELESIVVGAAAHAFTADWQRDDLVRVPDTDEMRAFVADYERARKKAFTPEERATAAASCVYAIAYTARCNHAANPAERGWNGDFRPLLERHGVEMLERW